VSDGVTDIRDRFNALPRRGFRSAAEVMIASPREAVVEGVAVAGGVTVLVGPSGAGKTFVLLSMAAAVANGKPWHGRKVEHGSVAFVSFEGDALGLRLRALEEGQGKSLDGLHVLEASDPLSPILDRDRAEAPSPGETFVAEALDELATELAACDRPPVRLVVVDTIRASLAGSEDSSETASAYLRAVRRILVRAPGAAAILAHHSGWLDGDTKRKRERGSSAFRGNVEGTVYLEPQGEHQLVLETRKLRDAEKPPPLCLVRRQVKLSIADRDGRPFTSCVIDADTRTAVDLEAERAAKDRETDLRVLCVIRDHPDATSQKAIRTYTRLRTEVVRDSLDRILAARWALRPEKQRHPYTLTAAGKAALEETE
jgi:hypothetical protein